MLGGAATLAVRWISADIDATRRNTHICKIAYHVEEGWPGWEASTPQLFTVGVCPIGETHDAARTTSKNPIPTIYILSLSL